MSENPVAPAQSPGNDLLMYACSTLDASGVEAALHHGADPNCQDPQGNTPLQIATRHGADPWFVNRLVEAGARTDYENRRGKKVRDLAIAADNHPVVDYLDSLALSREMQGGVAVGTAAAPQPDGHRS